MCDLARTFPPQAPHPGHPPGAHLYQQLRPELVRGSPLPLSSDAFSRMGNVAPQRYALPVATATRLLHTSVLPRFAADLVQRWARLTAAYPRSLQLLTEMHRRGINFRHLGRLLRLVAAPHQQSMVTPPPPRLPGHTLSYSRRNRSNWCVMLACSGRAPVQLIPRPPPFPGSSPCPFSRQVSRRSLLSAGAACWPQRNQSPRGRSAHG